MFIAMLRLRDAIGLRDGDSAIGTPRLILVMGVKAIAGTMHSSTNVSLYKIAHSMAIESVETRGSNFLFQMLQ
jgi:hypothetical protein